MVKRKHRRCALRWKRQPGSPAYYVSTDKSFHIASGRSVVSDRTEYTVKDRETGDTHDARTLRAAKAWACKQYTRG